MSLPSRPRIAFIKARWHENTVDQAYKGFVAAAEDLLPDALITSYDVPGAFEMPLVAKKLAASNNFDAIVAAALVVDGGIYRHDFVAGAVVTALMNVGLETGIPCFSVSLTPHNYQPSDQLTDFYFQHFEKKGKEAAHAVRQILDLEASLH